MDMSHSHIDQCLLVLCFCWLLHYNVTLLLCLACCNLAWLNLWPRLPRAILNKYGGSTNPGDERGASSNRSTDERTIFLSWEYRWNQSISRKVNLAMVGVCVSLYWWNVMYLRSLLPFYCCSCYLISWHPNSWMHMYVPLSMITRTKLAPCLCAL